MNRQEEYRKLVKQRKGCELCAHLGLTNPACFKGGIYDSDQIGPWSRWQGNLNAEIMVVGQDWGDTAYFEAWRGRDQSSGNPTNSNLQLLLQTFDITIEEPNKSQDVNRR